MLYTFDGKAPQVDPTAFVSASAELIGDVIVGPRCYIGPFAVIRADASRIVLALTLSLLGVSAPEKM